MTYILYSPEKKILDIEVVKIAEGSEKVELDFEVVDYSGIINEVMSIDLFVEKKTYLVTNAKFLTTKTSSLKHTALLNMFKTIAMSTNNIIFTIQKPVLKELITEYQDFIAYFDFEIDLDEWTAKQINFFIQSESIKIDQSNLALVSDNLNNDYHLVTNELSRLSLVNNDKNITFEIIEKYSFSTLEADVFAFIDAVMHNLPKKARVLYEQLLVQGSNPVSLLEMFATQIRFYYQVKLLSNSYKSKEIATLLKANPYRVSKTLNSLQKISHIQLINKYKKTAELEYLSKSGRINSDIVFDLLLS